MAGVWVFKPSGVIQLVENPQGGKSTMATGRKKVLVHEATGEAVESYAALESILKGLGWEKYLSSSPSSAEFLQFHRPNSIDLISLPLDFSRFNSVYMYDLVVKNPNVFHVRDL